MGDGVLEGVRVLDFGRYIAAPFCAALLADLGAEVIRIEAIGGNDDRFVMPVTQDEGAVFLQVNRNKSSLPIDFASPRAPALMRRLVERSDVVVANLVPKALAKLGLDYETLRASKPDIILTNITAFGAEGPQRDATGFDGTGQAMSGALYLTGRSGEPFRAAVSYVDYGTALAAAFGTVAAIHARSRTGRGQEVSASLMGTALTMMNPMLIEVASGVRTRVPTGNRSPIAGPSDVFQTSDGWVMVQVIGRRMFDRWAALVGADELVDDPRFADDIRRGENGAELSRRMDAWCRPRSTHGCLAALRAARIPGCPILSPADVLREPQHREGGFFDWVGVEGIDRTVPLVAPVRLSETSRPPARPAPALGEGAAGMLRRMGFSEAEIAGLGRDGIVSLAPELGATGEASRAVA